MSVPQPPRTSFTERKRRAWFVFGRRVLLVAAIGVALFALLLLMLQVPRFSTWLANSVLQRVSFLSGATLAVGEVRGNWLTRLDLRDLRMTRGDTTLVTADTLRIGLRPWHLLAQRVHMTHVEIVNPAVTSKIAVARQEERDRPSLTPEDVLRGRFYTGPTLLVDRLDVRGGRYALSAGADSTGSRIDEVSIAARDVVLGNTLAVGLDSLALRYIPKGAGAADAIRFVLVASVGESGLEVRRLGLRGPSSAATGKANVALAAPDSTSALEIELHADPLVLSDLALFLPGQEWEGDVTADVVLRGARLDRLSGSVRMRFTEARLRGVDFGPTDLQADFADGRAALEVATTWEGAPARVRGWARPLDRTPDYDLALELEGLPARLPGTPGWEAFARRGAPATRLHLSGRGYADAALQFDGDATSNDERIELRGGLRLRPTFEWELQRLALENLDVARWLGSPDTSQITGTFSARGRGTKADSLNIAATWELAACEYGARHILGAHGRATIAGRRCSGALRIEAPAGDVAIDSVTALLGDEGEIEFDLPALRFDRLDLAVLTANPELPSDLSGTLRLAGAVSGNKDRAHGAPIWRRLEAQGCLALEPSRFRDRGIQDGDARLRLHAGILDADLTIATDAGRARLLVEARPFDEQRRFEVKEVRFADVDVAAWADVPFSTRLSGVLTGKAEPSAGADARVDDRARSGITSGPFATWSAELRLESSQVGPIAVTGGAATADFASGHLTARADFETGAGDAAFRADAGLEGDRPAGSAHLVLPFGVLAALAGRDSLSTAGDLRVDARFAGFDLESATLDAEVEGHGHVGVWKVDSLRAALQLADGSLAVDTLTLRSNAAAIDASGRIALSDSLRTAPSDLRLKLWLDDPAGLGALLGADTLVLAEGQVEARLTGFPSAHAFTVTAVLDSVIWNDLTLRGVRSHAEGILGRTWRPIQATSTTQVTRLRGGAVPLEEAEIHADLVGGDTNIGLTAQLDAAHHVSLAATVARDSSGLRARLSEVEIQAREAHWQLVQPAELRYGNDRLSLDSLEIRADSALVLAYGTLDRHGDQDFFLRADRVGLDILAAWLARSDMDGMLDGQLSVTGPAAEPRAQGALRIAAVVAGVPVGVTEARLDWDGRQARMLASFATPQRDSVTMAGSLPLAISWFSPESAPESLTTEGEVPLRAVAHRFPLAALAPLLPHESVANLQGTLDADVRLSGRRGSMLGEGHIEVANGNIEFPSLGVTYKDLQFAGTLSGDRLTLRDARVQSGKGDLQLAGDVRFASSTLIEPHLTAKFRNFVFVNTPDLRVQASGDLQLAGSTSAPRLAGSVKASDCTYFITQSSMSGAQSAPEVVLTADDVAMLEDVFGYEYAKSGPPMQGVYDAADLDLQVMLDHDNWIRKRNAPVLALGITGDVHVRKPAHGELELRGRIAPVTGRSYLEQFGRTFDFVGGEVLLNGEMKDHTVDIRTEYKVRSSSGSSEPEVLVHLDVGGDMEKLRLDLSSEPPLSDSEIISYITTGRSPINPSAEVDKGSEAAALAAEIGLAQVTGPLEHTVQEKTGLDVLQVRYDALQGATLMAGRYLNPALYIGIQQPLQYREEGLDSSQNPYQTIVDVEYEAYRWLIVTLQGEASLLRSFIRARHAY